MNYDQCISKMVETQNKTKNDIECDIDDIMCSMNNMLLFGFPETTIVKYGISKMCELLYN